MARFTSGQVTKSKLYAVYFGSWEWKLGSNSGNLINYGNLKRVNGKTGKLWEFETCASSPAIGLDGTVYVRVRGQKSLCQSNMGI